MRWLVSGIAAIAAIAAAATVSAADPTTGMPNGPMRALAVTDDGRAAVSADLDGAVRLWPTLDGKREPVVVIATAPAALAITGDGDDFAIAGVDAAGGLELIRVTRAGVPVSRAPLDAGRPVTLAKITPDSLLALRDDQSIAIFDLRGTRTAVLVPPPGERIAALPTRRGHALALIATERGVVGRWIDIAAARWGDDTAVLPIEPAGAVLSTDLRRVAANVPHGGALAIVELATGKIVTRPGPPDLVAGEVLLPLGFVDAHTLAIARDDEQLAWWHDAWTNSRAAFTTIRNAPFAIADRAIVVGGESQLVLAAPDAVHYLGYRLSQISYVRRVRGGLILSDGQSAVRVDAHLRQRKQLALPKLTDATHTFAITVPLDLHHALAIAGAYQTASIYQVDLDTGKSEAIAAAGLERLDYEPSTHLVSWARRGAIDFAHVDPKTGALDEPVELTTETTGYDQAVLVDPARARGNVAIVVHEDSDGGITITPIAAIAAGQPVVTGDPWTIHKPSNWWSAVTRNDLTPFGFTAPLRRASPDGTLTAELAHDRVTLRDRDAVRWTVAIAGVRDLAWTDAGALIAIGGGTAQLDLATGALGDRQCGWGFGLGDEPADSAFAPQLCDAP